MATLDNAALESIRDTVLSEIRGNLFLAAYLLNERLFIDNGRGFNVYYPYKDGENYLGIYKVPGEDALRFELSIVSYDRAAQQNLYHKTRKTITDTALYGSIIGALTTVLLEVELLFIQMAAIIRAEKFK